MYKEFRNDFNYLNLIKDVKHVYYGLFPDRKIVVGGYPNGRPNSQSSVQPNSQPIVQPNSQPSVPSSVPLNVLPILNRVFC
jgi:hypothetical protein